MLMGYTAMLKLFLVLLIKLIAGDVLNVNFSCDYFVTLNVLGREVDKQTIAVWIYEFIAISYFNASGLVLKNEAIILCKYLVFE